MDYDFTFAHRQEGFDEHINKSIRGYSELLNDVIAYSQYFVDSGTNVVDIGCSTGKLTERMIEKNFGVICDVNWIGVELATGFVKPLRQREESLRKQFANERISFIFDDICNYEFNNCSLVTSIFTLQFMSPRKRKMVLQKLYDGLNEGGSFIMSEKTICENANFQEMLTFNYYDYKRKSFTTDDIMDKERELRHMLKPNTYEEIIDMLNDVGFRKTQCFWRNHMFVGILCLK
tara:strand:- start:52 stop:750 length:699 start_codon:yes stop_codon:yes gene_type:complete